MKKQTSSLLLCAGTGCMANGAEQVYNALKDELAKEMCWLLSTIY